ncbi:MAG: type II toxin-antitoxin system RelE/ParE family toxin [Myroides sp.]|uniref:type II toxin-antitoxin system RelE/ParE family toxin n=1 Tax=Chryseobacterium sp. TaxID=1871047 RepID=UPI002FC78079
MAITSFKHKGLKLLFIKGDESKIQQKLVPKIKRLLVIIDELEQVPEDLSNLQYLVPHKLKGDLAEFWSITVTGNVRIIFKFNNLSKEATDVNLLDYH